MGQLLGRFVYIPTSANRRHCHHRRRLRVPSTAWKRNLTLAHSVN